MSDLHEWENKKNKSYFKKQLEKPYESTIEVTKFLNNNIDLTNLNLLDVATGSGANLFYLLNNTSLKSGTGVDFVPEYINYANQYKNQNQVNNANFICEDFYDFSPDIKYQIVTCLQTLSWINEYENFVKKIMDIGSRWIAFSSLFYDGLIETNTLVNVLDTNSTTVETSQYNTISIPKLERIMKKKSYFLIGNEKFDIKKDLVQKNNNEMGTYTILSTSGRLQISGPLLMNWHFLLFEKQI